MQHSILKYFELHMVVGGELHILGVNYVVCELQFSKLVPKNSHMADHKHLKSLVIEHLPACVRPRPTLRNTPQKK